MASNIDNTPDENELIALAQRNLEELGIENASLSHHGAIIRLQVPAADFDRAIQMREAIVNRLKTIGYRYVALDFESK